MAELSVTTFGPGGVVLSQETVDILDPEPTVEERLAAVEQTVIAPAKDGKTLAQKVDDLQQVLVAKGVIDRADTIEVVKADGDVAVEVGPGVAVEVP